MCSRAKPASGTRSDLGDGRGDRLVCLDDRLGTIRRCFQGSDRRLRRMTSSRLHVRLTRAGSRLVACTAALLLAVFSAPAFAQAPSVYFDQAHGETRLPPPMAEFANRAGFTVHLGQGAIDATALAGHRVLYLRAPNAEITAPERDAIVAFVKAGGSLLVVVDEESRQPIGTTKINDLLAPFGMTLTADTPYIHNTGAVARSGEVTRASYEVPYSGGRAIDGGTAFAWQLDAEGKPAQPFAAWTKVAGGGRVIVMAEGMVSLFLGTPEGKRLTGGVRDPSTTTYWGKDSAPFMADVFAWLLAR